MFCLKLFFFCDENRNVAQIHLSKNVFLLSCHLTEKKMSVSSISFKIVQKFWYCTMLIFTRIMCRRVSQSNSERGFSFSYFSLVNVTSFIFCFVVTFYHSLPSVEQQEHCFCLCNRVLSRNYVMLCYVMLYIVFCCAVVSATLSNFNVSVYVKIWFSEKKKKLDLIYEMRSNVNNKHCYHHWHWSISFFCCFIF